MVKNYDKLQEIEKRVREKYNVLEGQDLAPNLTYPLEDLFEHAGGLKGKRILDLGCGSVSYDPHTSFDNYMNVPRGGDEAFCENSKRSFEPWLCRALHELGAYPIGIDIGSLEEEPYEHYGHTNLLISNALEMIPGKSIDIIHTRLLYSSPQLGTMTNTEEREKNRARLHNLWFPQFNRIIRAGGVFVDEYDFREPDRNRILKAPFKVG